jgi:hypothetical protein
MGGCLHQLTHTRVDHFVVTRTGAGSAEIRCASSSRHLDVSGGAIVRLRGVLLSGGAADIGGCLKITGVDANQSCTEHRNLQQCIKSVT